MDGYIHQQVEIRPDRGDTLLFTHPTKGLYMKKIAGFSKPQKTRLSTLAALQCSSPDCAL
jgi:hypothetical protein